MQKGDYLDIKETTSIINKVKLEGVFQFDSFEKADNKETCYITKKIGNGMTYLVPTIEMENYLIPGEDYPKYGLPKKKHTKPTT